MTVSITLRMKAASIVKALRDQRGRLEVAELLGISAHYVTCTEHMTKFKNRGELVYIVPETTIQKIIAWNAQREIAQSQVG
jgi:hypothetical protein